MLVFDHVPKTGGTTFRRSYLTAALPRAERFILSGGERNEDERRQFLALSEKRRRRYRVVAGHDAGLLRPHLPQARFITVVREPVARTTSEYLHVILHPNVAAKWAVARKEAGSLGEYVERYGRGNVQSRTVLGDAAAGLDDDAIVACLGERYALVGCTEALDEFVFLLHVEEGLPLCLYNNRMVRAERASFVPSREELELVARMNTMDARLHRVVRGQFDARLAALSSEARRRLRRWQAALEAFRQRTGGDITQAERLPDDW